MTEAYIDSGETAVKAYCDTHGASYRTINAGKWAVEVKHAKDVDEVYNHFGAENIIGFTNRGE
jgi:hypothetical protein